MPNPKLAEGVGQQKVRRASSNPSLIITLGKNRQSLETELGESSRIG